MRGLQSFPLPSGERVWVRGEGPSARAENLNPSPGAFAPTSPLRGEVTATEPQFSGAAQ